MSKRKRPTMVNINSAVGDGARVTNVFGGGQRSTADVGILVALSLEMRAVLAELRTSQSYGEETFEGAHFHRATVDEVRVAAVRAGSQGQRSALVAFERLRRYCAPRTIIQVGIAGAVAPELRIGDVVIASAMIYYDERRVSPEGVHHRGQALPVPAETLYDVNNFLDVHGPRLGSARIMVGPIGSGEAVITDAGAEIRGYLVTVNEKVLCVETEAGAVAQGYYEAVSGDRSLRGWLAVRGISDHADQTKDDAHHDLAATNAARVAMRFIQATGGPGRAAR